MCHLEGIYRPPLQNKTKCIDQPKCAQPSPQTKSKHYSNHIVYTRNNDSFIVNSNISMFLQVLWGFYGGVLICASRSIAFLKLIWTKRHLLVPLLNPDVFIHMDKLQKEVN